MIFNIKNYYLSFPTGSTAVFIVVAIVAIFIDLFVHRYNKLISLKNAATWSLFWLLIAATYATFLYVYHGAELAIMFLAGYTLELVLSIDNLFVIMAIITSFKIPNKYHYRVLSWGLLGAVAFRGIFIAIGTRLLSLGPYVEIIFALIIGWTAVMMMQRNENRDNIEDYSSHPAYRVVKYFCPIWPKISNHRFIIAQKKVNDEFKKLKTLNIAVKRSQKVKYYVTPLFLCLMVVEISDAIFAFDSVPAVITISREPLIIYSAIIFAMFSLRHLYFVLGILKKYFLHLEKSVIVLLLFFAFKLGLNSTDHIWNHGYNISTTTSFLMVLGVLVLGIIASLIFPPKRGT